MFDHAAELCQSLGDVRGEAEALFWAGCFYQIVRRDNGAAVPLLDRSLEFATEAATSSPCPKRFATWALRRMRPGSCSCRPAAAGGLHQAAPEIGLLPGVAANLIGLAYIAAAQGRRDDALALLDEAGAIAETSGAHRIARSVSEARAAV